MLDFLRRKAQSPYIQGTIVVIIIVFVFWLPKMGGNGSPDTVATVNGEPVGLREFQKRYEQTMAQYRDQLGGAIPPGLLESLGLKRQVVRQLIEERLILQGAAAAGIRASKSEVQAAIQGMESFKEQGIFNLDRYQKLLASSRLSTKEFEAGIRTDLLKRKVMGHLGHYAQVSEPELRARFNHIYDEIRLRYAVFEPAAFTRAVSVSDEALQKYYDTAKERYKTEPQAKVQYLAFRRAEGDTEEAFKKANEAYEAIIVGGSLAKGAEAKQLTPQQTDFFSQTAPPAALAAYPEVVGTALTLKQGELSSLLETRDGYVILFVTERKEPAVPALAEVRERVARDFTNDKARELAQQAAAAMLAAVKGGRDFAAEAAANKTTVRESVPYSRATANASGLPAAVAASGLLLSDKNPFPDKTPADSGRYYVVQLAERRQAPEALLAEKRPELLAVARQEKELLLLTAWAEYLENRAKITTNSQYL
ncbi:MAG: SurA N-terminal domain-containing protein [Thermodesulfobacteriota bacterium]